jgi:hypothetical protein
MLFVVLMAVQEKRLFIVRQLDTPPVEGHKPLVDEGGV